ncbi:hypothetical protein Drorol1_Dr00020307, partial [Drosera rotundifolia]
MFHFMRGMDLELVDLVQTQEFHSLAAMVERAAALEGAMVVVRAVGSRRGREEPTQTQTQGGNDKKKKFNNKSENSSVSYTQPSQCRRCGQSHSYGYTCDGTPRTCFGCGEQGHIR